MPSNVWWKGEDRQVSGEESDLIPVSREMFAGGAQHVLGEINAYDAAVGQGLQQIFGEAAGAASGVEQDFVPFQFDAGENLFAPTDLRSRDAVVGGGIPFAGGHGARLNEMKTAGDAEDARFYF